MLSLKRDYRRRPAALRRAAHLAFIASESFFLPAAVSPPPFFLAGALATAPPFRKAHRLRAAAASLARVAADIGRRDPPLALRDLLGLLDLLVEGAADPPPEPPPEKSELKRRSSVLI
jgi:hypothetical protein